MVEHAARSGGVDPPPDVPAPLTYSRVGDIGRAWPQLSACPGERRSAGGWRAKANGARGDQSEPAAPTSGAYGAGRFAAISGPRSARSHPLGPFGPGAPPARSARPSPRPGRLRRRSAAAARPLTRGPWLGRWAALTGQASCPARHAGEARRRALLGRGRHVEPETATGPATRARRGCRPLAGLLGLWFGDGPRRPGARRRRAALARAHGRAAVEHGRGWRGVPCLGGMVQRDDARMV